MSQVSDLLKTSQVVFESGDSVSIQLYFVVMMVTIYNET